MKLSLEASVLLLTHEGVVNFGSMCGFDKKSIHKLPSVCNVNVPAIEVDAIDAIAAEASVAGSRVS